jgi:PTS system galactitol-specific IIA component
MRERMVSGYARAVLIADVADTLFLPRIACGSDREAIETLARALGDRVAPTFAAAALAREKRSPTGLPFEDAGVAIPHGELEHVRSPAIAVASLAKPVRFRQMGSPKVQLDVSLVVMPALTAKEQAAASLSAIIQLLQNASIRRALLDATTEEAMRAALAEAR